MKIIFNKTEWLVISIILTIVSGILTNWFDWAVYPMWAGLAYVAGFGLVMIFSGIKNEINDLK